jgi:hypothetical protein
VTWQVANWTKLIAYVVVVTTHVISLDGDAIKPNRCINCVNSQYYETMNLFHLIKTCQ